MNLQHSMSFLRCSPLAWNWLIYICFLAPAPQGPGPRQPVCEAFPWSPAGVSLRLKRHLPCARLCAKAVQKHFLSSVSFYPMTALYYGCPYWSHFMDEETEAERSSNVSAITDSRWQPHSRAPAIPWLHSYSLGWHLLCTPTALWPSKGGCFISSSFLWKVRSNMYRDKPLCAPAPASAKWE